MWDMALILTGFLFVVSMLILALLDPWTTKPYH